MTALLITHPSNNFNSDTMLSSFQTRG